MEEPPFGWKRSSIDTCCTKSSVGTDKFRDTKVSQPQMYVCRRPGFISFKAGRTTHGPSKHSFMLTHTEGFPYDTIRCSIPYEFAMKISSQEAKGKVFLSDC